MKLLVLLCAFLAVYCETIGPQTDRISEEDKLQFSDSYTETDKPFKDNGEITCFCDGEDMVHILRGQELDERLKKIVTPGYCEQNVKSSACRFVRRCSFCNIEVRWCRPLMMTSNYYCRIKNRDIPQPRIESTSEDDDYYEDNYMEDEEEDDYYEDPDMEYEEDER